MTVVTIPGAHLQQQASGGSNANGQGGSAPICPHLTGPPAIFDPNLSEAKRLARAQALASRNTADPAWGARLALHVMRAGPPLPRTVAGFWPLPGEIDIRPLLETLAERGHVIALPVTPPRGQPLSFRRWRRGEKMLAGRFGTYHPGGPDVVPELLLVPLLAFDRRGHRLGYGAGFYDRTMVLLAGVPRIGCAFACQELEQVPAGPFDQRLDAVATEREVIQCRTADEDP